MVVSWLGGGRPPASATDQSGRRQRMLRNRSVREILQRLIRTLDRRADGERRGVLLASLLLFICGWGGLAYLVVSARPRIGAEIWLFFIFLQIAVTGTAIPLALLTSQLMASKNAPYPMTGVVVRRSVWAGIVVVICAWLMIPRYLSLPAFVVVVLLFVALEVFLRYRELAHDR